MSAPADTCVPDWFSSLPPGVAKLWILFWLALAPMGWTADAMAADIEGVWASDSAQCGKIFVKRGKTVVFAKDADIHGSGFIIEGRKIRGKTANCSIKTMKEDGSTVHMLAACATDIMLSNVQFSLKIVDRNRVVRIFPGVSDTEISFERCTLP